MKMRKTIVYAGIITLALYTMMFGTFLWAIYLPTVYESWGSQECVAVDDPTGTYDCDNLPPRYQHRWAE